MSPLFVQAENRGRKPPADREAMPENTDPTFVVYSLMTRDLQEVAEEQLGRTLTREELEVVARRIDFDWREEIELILCLYLED
ncbi:MAG: hypothetical protein AAGA92_07735 [Planctomycetota bacterium]